MKHRKTGLVAFTLLVTASSPAFLVDTYASASMYAPPTAYDGKVWNNRDDWVRDGRNSYVSAVSESHPFDPPINVASASCSFVQPEWTDATLRAQSFVISDYSGIGATGGYRAASSFTLAQRYSVEVLGWPGGYIDFKAIVPMHGLMATYGHYETGGGGVASASATSSVVTFDENGVLKDSSYGSLTVESADYNEFEWTAGGDWVGRVDSAYVELPTGNEPRSANGVELSGYELVSFGALPMGGITHVSLEMTLGIESLTSTPNGSFSLCDFSGTGGFQMLAFDENGDPFYDFTVNAVPEPGTFAVLGIGLAALTRKRRRAKEDSELSQ